MSSSKHAELHRWCNG